MVLTFEPHPREYFAPAAGAGAADATCATRRMELREAGVAELRVLHFDAALSAAGMAVTFIERVLDRGMGAKQVVIGEDFRFGT